MMFSLACFIVRLEYIIGITYKICVSGQFWVRLPVSSWLLIVKFWGSHKLYVDFQLCLGVQCPEPLCCSRVNSISFSMTWKVVLRGNLNWLLFGDLAQRPFALGFPGFGFS